MPPRFRLRIQTGPRDPAKLPLEADALGEAVMDRVRGALEKGFPRPAMLLLRDHEVQQLDVVPLMQAAPEHRERMLAAAAGQDDVRCAVLAGALSLRRRVKGQLVGHRAVVVYLEFPDNRWWTAWQLVGDDRGLLGDGPVLRRATDGSPRPGGVGGWFARARREGLKLQLERPPGQQGLDLVH